MTMSPGPVKLSKIPLRKWSFWFKKPPYENDEWSPQSPLTNFELSCSWFRPLKATLGSSIMDGLERSVARPGGVWKTPWLSGQSASLRKSRSRIRITEDGDTRHPDDGAECPARECMNAVLSEGVVQWFNELCFQGFFMSVVLLFWLFSVATAAGSLLSIYLVDIRT